MNRWALSCAPIGNEAKLPAFTCFWPLLACPLVTSAEISFKCTEAQATEVAMKATQTCQMSAFKINCQFQLISFDRTAAAETPSH
jgi:hypothetical protein